MQGEISDTMAGHLKSYIWAAGQIMFTFVVSRELVTKLAPLAISVQPVIRHGVAGAPNLHRFSSSYNQQFKSC